MNILAYPSEQETKIISRVQTKTADEMLYSPLLASTAQSPGPFVLSNSLMCHVSVQQLQLPHPLLWLPHSLVSIFPVLLLPPACLPVSLPVLPKVACASG